MTLNPSLPPMVPALDIDALNRLNDARAVLSCLHGLLCHVCPDNPGLNDLNAHDLAVVLRLALDQFPERTS